MGIFYSKRRSVALRDEWQYGCPHRRRLEEWYAALGYLSARIVELGSYHAMLGCFATSMGAVPVPRSVLSGFAEAMGLTVLNLTPGLDRLRTLLIYRNGTSTPNVKALADLLDTNPE